MDHCFDAAVMPSTAPAHCTAVLGYVGGPSAYRVTPLNEWLRFKALKQFPAYVADVSLNPEVQAADAVKLVRARGWAAGRAIVCDLETQHNRQWWLSFDAKMRQLGNLPVCYGSASTVGLNGAEWNWFAEWDGMPALDDGQTDVATQYAADIAFSGTRIDLSVVSAVLMLHAGQGPRR